MLERFCLDQKAAAIEIFDNVRVGVFDETPVNELGNVTEELAFLVDGFIRRPSVRASDREVLGAKRRRDVYDTRAVFHRNEVGGDDRVNGTSGDIEKGWSVVGADQIGSCEPSAGRRGIG